MSPSGDERGTGASDLRQAFRDFNEVARQAQEAWRRLRDCARSLDRDLAAANQRLRSQVDALQNLSGSLAAVLRAIPSGVVVADTHGVVVMANPAAEDILGIKGRDMIGRAAEDLLDVRGDPCLAMVSGCGRTGERMIHTRAGPRLVDGQVVAATDADGTRLGFVEVLTDKSEVEALKNQVRRLDNLAELGRVAAIIAHEIRNPLAGIRGFASLLERDIGDDPRDRRAGWVARILEGADRADRIIDSVLFLARPTPRPFRRVNVRSLIDEAVRAVCAAAPKLARGVEVRRSIDPGLAVMGDAVRLNQALCNLIENAFEAMDGKGTLDLRVRRRESGVEISVEDSGPGIDPEVREHLFEPFFTTRSGGAGLGLSLVQRIAEAHGGAIRCETGARGARFVLRLPEAEERTETLER